MIEVRVRYTKAAQADPSLMAKLQQPMVLAQAVAQRVSSRVAKEGRTATPAPGYSTKGRRYAISEAYAQQVGVTERYFRTSAEFHAKVGAKPGAYRVSGGMWSGLQVRNMGGSSAVIDFAGSSIGSSRQSTKTATGRNRSRPVKVRNQAKAGAVFGRSGVNVLQPTALEEEALLASVTRWSQQILGRILGAEAGSFSTTADQQLLREILQRYDGSR